MPGFYESLAEADVLLLSLACRALLPVATRFTVQREPDGGSVEQLTSLLQRPPLWLVLLLLHVCHRLILLL